MISRNATPNQATPPPSPLDQLDLTPFQELFEHEAQSIPSANPPRQQAVFAIGSIARISLPSGWCSTLFNTLEGLTRSLICPSNSASIRVSLRDKPMDDRVADNFRQLLASKPAQRRAEVLLPREIRSISSVLAAPSTINQHVLTEGYSFLLHHAATINVNGKTVLEVRGDFVDRDGGSISTLHGFYWEFENSRRVQEIVLKGDFMQLAKLNGVIKRLLNSIWWAM